MFFSVPDIMLQYEAPLEWILKLFYFEIFKICCKQGPGLQCPHSASWGGCPKRGLKHQAKCLPLGAVEWPTSLLC